MSPAASRAAPSCPSTQCSWSVQRASRSSTTRSASGVVAASRVARSAAGPRCWATAAGSCPSGRVAVVGRARRRWRPAARRHAARPGDRRGRGRTRPRFPARPAGRRGCRGPRPGRRQRGAAGGGAGVAAGAGGGDRDRVQRAFDQHRPGPAGQRPPYRLGPQAVEHLPLPVQRGGRAVEVARGVLGLGQRPAEEADDALPARVADREHQPVAEPVHHAAAAGGQADTGVEQLGVGVAAGAQVVGERGPAGRGVAELVAGDRYCLLTDLPAASGRRPWMPGRASGAAGPRLVRRDLPVWPGDFPTLGAVR